MCSKNNIGVMVLVMVLSTTTALPTLECKDGHMYGTEELTQAVEKTISDCSNKTSSKADLFTCVFKGLNMFNDEKPALEKIKGFFENVFTSKVITSGKKLLSNIMTCAENYAKSFQVKDMEALGKAGEAFSQCFMEATKAYQRMLEEKCTGKTSDTQATAGQTETTDSSTL